MQISRKGLSNGEPLELIKLAYALNKERLNEELKKVQLKIVSEDDLAKMAKLCNSSGVIVLKLKEGNQSFMFDVKSALESMIDFNQSELDSVKELMTD